MGIEYEPQRRLDRIAQIFHIDEIIKKKKSEDDIKHYYKINRLAYSWLHTKSDFMYMGISRDGMYKESDLKEAARTVAKYIRDLKANNVLELATGRGANSYFLAKQFPKTKFLGIDYSEGQLQYAMKKSTQCENYKPEYGDYHDLKRYRSSSIDIIFAVEGLCYSQKKEVVLYEANRVLKRRGVFIIFDGYQDRKLSTLSDLEQKILKLIEKGMALQEFENYRTFCLKARKANFEIIHEEDASEYILPTLARFEKLAGKFFRHPFLARIIRRILPEAFTHNAISGYLMPLGIELHLTKYMITILQKI